MVSISVVHIYVQCVWEECEGLYVVLCPNQEKWECMDMHYGFGQLYGQSISSMLWTAAECCVCSYAQSAHSCSLINHWLYSWVDKQCRLIIYN